MDMKTTLSPAPADHKPVAFGKVGVLLVNLGTPEALTTEAVKVYLAEFLSDRRVVDYPAFLWQPVLRGVILNTRPSKTRDAYAKIWDQETNESPLRRYTREQSDKLTKLLPDDLVVDWAMRYGVPSMADRLTAMQEAGCDRILLLPLYPQYSATTTGTACDAAFKWAMSRSWQPALRTVPAFHDDSGLIEALAQSCRDHVKPETERLIISFHGLPQRYFEEGDPYHCQCQKTARLLRETMGWDEKFAPVSFQSKFGPEKWLEPSTESLVVQAAEEGLKNIAVITPGFVSDCIETLEEVAMELAEEFEEAGGEHLQAIPCLNSDDQFIEVLNQLVRRELGGWLPDDH